MKSTINCVVYKGKRKAGSYLYIETENDFSKVPEQLIDLLGDLEMVLSFQLNAEKKLAQADPFKVIEALKSQGYYLQTPDESDKLRLADKKAPSHHLPRV